jgi:hypothetical protein
MFLGRFLDTECVGKTERPGEIPNKGGGILKIIIMWITETSNMIKSNTYTRRSFND